MRTTKSTGTDTVIGVFPCGFSRAGFVIAIAAEKAHIEIGVVWRGSPVQRSILFSHQTQGTTLCEQSKLLTRKFDVRKFGNLPNFMSY